MSAIADRVSEWTRRGIEIWEVGASLGYDAPSGVLTPELITEIRSSESEIVAFLRSERAKLFRKLTPRPVGDDDNLPMSSTETVWWGSIRAGYDKSSATDMALAMYLKGPLAVEALERALAELTHRHEVFRTRFFLSEGVLRRTVDACSQLKLKKVARDEGPRASGEADITTLIENEVRKPFDLGADHLIRAVLVKDSAERYVLGIVLHHLIFDAASAVILVEDLFEIYNCLVSGTPLSVSGSVVQYADYAMWEIKLVESQKRSVAHYWSARLEGRKDWSLPYDLDGEPYAPVISRCYFAEMSKDVSEALASYAVRKKATLYVVLLAALKSALHAWSGETDISVWSIMNARRHPSLRRVIGHFAYHVILRSDLSSNPTLAEVIERLRDGYLRDFSFLPFDGRQRKGRPPPVVVNLFSEALPLAEELKIGDLRVGLYPLELAAAPSPILPLTLDMELHKSGIKLRVRYNGNLFHEATIARLLKAFLEAQKLLIQKDDAPLSSIVW